MNEGNSSTGKVERQDGTIINWADLLQSLKSDIQTLNNNMLSNLNNILSNLESSIGSDGGVYIDDANVHSPDDGYIFFAIQPLEDIIINTIIGNIDISGATIYMESNVVYGEWTSITLTSGSCIAYQKES